MKKTLITLFATALTTSVFAAPSGTLNLKGFVAESLNISVSAETVATNLDLHTNKSNLKVASVLEQSNSKKGYKVKVSSSNKGLLAHEDGKNVDSVTYEMTYGGKSVDLKKGETFSQTTAGAYNVPKDVKVSYNGRAATEMVAGEYSDVVTFTISSN